MTVSFHTSTTHNPLDTCSICLMPLEKKNVIFHDNQGEKHPIHKKCMEVWAKITPCCPSCKQPANLSSLLSWKERAIVTCQHSLYALTTKIQRIAQTERGLEVVTGGLLSLSSLASFFIWSKIVPGVKPSI